MIFLEGFRLRTDVLLHECPHIPLTKPSEDDSRPADAQRNQQDHDQHQCRARGRSGLGQRLPRPPPDWLLPSTCGQMRAETLHRSATGMPAQEMSWRSSVIRVRNFAPVKT